MDNNTCPRCQSSNVVPYLTIDRPTPHSGLLVCSDCELLGTPTAMRKPK